jgi:lipopolysaccharide transport system ATP-binding protein
MSGETLIKVENVSKKFCRNLKKSLWYGMQDLGSEILGRPHASKGELRPDEFWAVKDVSFELKRGECLGLIGRNGAGKTTLLRMLNGLIKPDRGRVELRGRVGALIALGAGFNPILTGRENIYVNASILGLSKADVDNKLDEIIEFAEIEEFIDMPVQGYSSGMSVRLGFSVAAILIEPDILFLDEVLAVGDIGFTIKCLNVVRGLAQRSAVVFVSHNMQYISAFCTRVMVLDRGGMLLDAAHPAEGIDCYFALMQSQFQISGTGEAEITDIEFLVNDRATDLAAQEQPSDLVVPQGVTARVRLTIRVARVDTRVIVSLFVIDEAMTPVVGIPICDEDGAQAKLCGPILKLVIPLGIIDLNSGKYSLMLAVSDACTKDVLLRVQGLSPFRVFAKRSYWAKVVRPVYICAPPQSNSIDLCEAPSPARHGEPA